MADKQTVSEPKPLSEKSDKELQREARARLKRLSPAAASELMNEAAVSKKVANPVAGFVTFLRERAVVGLAIGFVIGTQAQAVVKQLIDSLINPLFGLVVPGKTLKDLSFTLHLGSRSAPLGWGALVYTLLDFLFILAVIYAVIKLFQLDKLDKKQ